MENTYEETSLVGLWLREKKSARCETLREYAKWGMTTLIALKDEKKEFS